MADLNHSIGILRAALQRIPPSSLGDKESEIVQAYLSTLNQISRQLGQSFQNVQLPNRFEDETRAAEDAAKSGDWESVLRHVYASIVSLPGDSGWRPIRDIPPPK